MPRVRRDDFGITTKICIYLIQVPYIHADFHAIHKHSTISHGLYINVTKQKVVEHIKVVGNSPEENNNTKCQPLL